MSGQDAFSVGAQDSGNLAMSALYTQHPLQDSKLESGKEQGTFS
jgi:hypothetical protein